MKVAWMLSNSRKMFARGGSRVDRLIELVVTLQRELQAAKRNSTMARRIEN